MASCRSLPTLSILTAFADALKLRLGASQGRNRLDLLQIVEGIDELGDLHHEKFPALGDETGWDAGSVFHLIDSLGQGTEMNKLMRGFDDAGLR